MQKLRLTLIAVLLLLASGQSLRAQDSTGKKGIERKNVIKINPISPVFSNLFVGYERALNDKFTAQLTLGYMSLSAAKIPVLDIGKLELDDAGNTTFDAGAVSLKGFTFMPEARFYAAHKKRALPRGFYVGPYIRYQSHTLSAPAIEYSGYDSSTGMQVDTTLFNAFDIKLSSFGVGLTWGWQAMIGQRVTFEWNMGAGYKKSNLTLPDQKLIDPTTGKEEDIFGNLEDKADDLINKVPLGLRFGFTLGVAF